MDDSLKAKFQKLEDWGYLPAVRDKAMKMAGAFFWHGEMPGEGYKVLHNGTICYVDTGKRYVGITAAHVYRQYLKDRAAHPGIVAQFSGKVVDPAGRLIECNDKLDLCTFLLSEKFVKDAGGLFHRAPCWPPVRGEMKNLVIYGGFPGVLREPGDTTIDFPFQHFAWRLSDVSTENLVMFIDYKNLYWPGHEGEQINEDPGGVSGGPVYRLIEKPGFNTTT